MRERPFVSWVAAAALACGAAAGPAPMVNAGVSWDSPGFTPNVGGTGKITDADPRRGGQFRADWVEGRWHIVYPYC